MDKAGKSFPTGDSAPLVPLASLPVGYIDSGHPIKQFISVSKIPLSTLAPYDEEEVNLLMLGFYLDALEEIKRYYEEGEEGIILAWRNTIERVRGVREAHQFNLLPVLLVRIDELLNKDAGVPGETLALSRAAPPVPLQKTIDEVRQIVKIYHAQAEQIGASLTELYAALENEGMTDPPPKNKCRSLRYAQLKAWDIPCPSRDAGGLVHALELWLAKVA